MNEKCEDNSKRFDNSELSYFRKRFADDQNVHWTETYIPALLYRLEMSEKVCDAVKDLPLSGWLLEGDAPSWAILIEAIKTWRKSVGR